MLYDAQKETFVLCFYLSTEDLFDLHKKVLVGGCGKGTFFLLLNQEDFFSTELACGARVRSHAGARSRRVRAFLQ